MYKKYLVVLSALVLALGLAACNQDQGGATGTSGSPSDTGSTMGGTSSPGEDKMGGSTAGSAAQITVTNPMPHDMIVSGDWGQGEQSLGTVPAGGTQTFDVTAAAGTEINLTATDAGRTHSPKGKVTVSANEPAAWTIQ